MTSYPSLLGKSGEKSSIFHILASIGAHVIKDSCLHLSTTFWQDVHTNYAQQSTHRWQKKNPSPPQLPPP